MLGRIQTRTRDRIYCQTIRTVRDISRDDRVRIANCSLRTLTYRLKENYSIDYSIDKAHVPHLEAIEADDRPEIKHHCGIYTIKFSFF